uniref:Uncharacterized protein n=1 Tax=Glossina pallidipes TaxID=7398 RepID=A0A1B0A9L0_GLOPL
MDYLMSTLHTRSMCTRIHYFREEKEAKCQQQLLCFNYHNKYAKRALMQTHPYANRCLENGRTLSMYLLSLTNADKIQKAFDHPHNSQTPHTKCKLFNLSLGYFDDHYRKIFT